MAEVVILSSRVPVAVVATLDGKRGALTRSEAIRRAIEAWQGERAGGSWPASNLGIPEETP